MKGRLLTDIVHVAALSNFAVAQPLYELMSQNAPFLAAHHAQPRDLLLLVLVLSLGLPGVLAGVEALLVGRRLRPMVHSVVVALLAAAIALPALKRLPLPGGAGLAPAALVAGTAFALAYRRWPAVRLLVTFSAPGIVVFPGLFLLRPGIAPLLRPAASAAPPHTVPFDTPIVMVVFDEFPLVSLLDEKLQIDAKRYPNFAALAREATWFRNATTVSPSTATAVPVLLSGREPGPVPLPPTCSAYPHNLFTWLAGRYDLNVFEPVTCLAPPECSPGARRGTRARLGSMLADLGVVYLHHLGPPAWRRHLPDVSQGWKDFATCACCPAQSERAETFARFVDSVRPGPRPTLHFLHLVFPHVPLCFLPSGKSYGSFQEIDGLRMPEDAWTDEEEPVNRAYQRHLLQVGCADTMLGRLLERLRKQSLYDRALVVVVADHGSSFQPGRPHREVNPENPADVLRVPMLVKKPGQRQGVVSDRNVQAHDLLPTLAGALGGRLPWAVDGRSALDPSQPERPEKFLWTNGRRLTFSPQLGGSFGSLRRKLTLFGSGSYERLFEYGPGKEWLGRPVADARLEPAGPGEVELDQPDLLADVSPASPFVPACIRGRVYGADGEAANRPLAVAVNGVVRAVTRAARDGGRWSVVVPESAFQAGANRVEVFGVRGVDRLQRLRDRGAAVEPYRLAGSRSQGGEFLVTPAGERIAVSSRALQGCLDVVEVENGCVSFAGWAADAQAGRVPHRVLMLADGTCVHAGRADVERPDVSVALGQPRLGRAGFRFYFPAERLRRLGNARIRFFAVDDRGKASELKYPAWYRPGRPLPPS